MEAAAVGRMQELLSEQCEVVSEALSASVDHLTELITHRMHELQNDTRKVMVREMAQLQKENESFRGEQPAPITSGTGDGQWQQHRASQDFEIVQLRQENAELRGKLQDFSICAASAKQREFHVEQQHSTMQPDASILADPDDSDPDVHACRWSPDSMPGQPGMILSQAPSDGRSDGRKRVQFDQDNDSDEAGAVVVEANSWQQSDASSQRMSTESSLDLDNSPSMNFVQFGTNRSIKDKSRNRMEGTYSRASSRLQRGASKQRNSGRTPMRDSVIACSADPTSSIEFVNPNHHHYANTKAVFADASAMKEKVRAAVSKKEYNVCDYYYDTGCFQYVARSSWFEYLTLGVIGFNAFWITIDLDNNNAVAIYEAQPIYQVAEHGLCLYFLWEWSMRYFSFRGKRNCFKDAWFIFDTILLVLMVLESWVMTLIMYGAGDAGGASFRDASVLKLVRLVRLARMARMVKLLRMIPELVVLIRGMLVASRSVGFTLILLGLVIYFFAIVSRQLALETPLEDKYFRSVPDAMMSLLLECILPDQSQMVRECSRENPLFGIVILLVILLGSLTMLNMLVGVLCEVVSVVSSVEREQLTVNYLKTRLVAMFAEGGDGRNPDTIRISHDSFESMLLQPEAATIIQNIGVDVIGLVDFADYIFENCDELGFGDFIELLLQFRGSNTATVKDIVDVRKFILAELDSMIQYFESSLQSLYQGLDKSHGEKLEHVGKMFRQASSAGQPRALVAKEGKDRIHVEKRSRQNSSEVHRRSPTVPAGQHNLRNTAAHVIKRDKNLVGNRVDAPPPPPKLIDVPPPLPCFPVGLWSGEGEDEGDQTEQAIDTPLKASSPTNRAHSGQNGNRVAKS